MTIHVSRSEIQEHFLELFEQVLNGEEIIIAAENGSEIARLIPSLHKAAHEIQSLVADTPSKSQDLGQTLDKALEGLIGVISLQNAPTDLSEKTGQYFRESLAEKYQREQGKDR